MQKTLLSAWGDWLSQPPNALIGRVKGGVAAVRFLRGSLFAEVRIGIRDLRVKSAVRRYA